MLEVYGRLLKVYYEIPAYRQKIAKILQVLHESNGKLSATGKEIDSEVLKYLISKNIIRLTYEQNDDSSENKIDGGDDVSPKMKNQDAKEEQAKGGDNVSPKMKNQDAKDEQAKELDDLKKEYFYRIFYEFSSLKIRKASEIFITTI